MIFQQNNRKAADNFLLYIPVKNHNNWMQKDNIIYLVFRHDRPIERFAAWLTRKPTIRDIKLDKLGTRVWQLMDGNTTVFKIGQLLSQEYGKGCEPVYERLIVYLRYLNRKGWIRFKLPDGIKHNGMANS